MAPSIIFGTASIGGKFSDAGSVASLLTTLTASGITHLDTAARYGANYGSGPPVGSIGDSESLLGTCNAAARGFAIDSKILFLGNGEQETTMAKVEESTLQTLARLKVDRVRYMYIHAPDNLTPIAEQAAAMDAQVRAGRCEGWGLSNFSVKMTKELIDVCKEQGYVLPRVYQGQYNLLRRGAERELLGMCRTEGMGFVAYSPLASGLLSVGEGKAGNELLDGLYGEERVRGAVERFKKALDGFGIGATEAALRWVVFHSALGEGDAVIIGASREEQVVSSMEIVKKGPLDQEVVEVVEQVWEDVRRKDGRM
jgi:aflatoxin B1 aldehyde reductase